VLRILLCFLICSFGFSWSFYSQTEKPLRKEIEVSEVGGDFNLVPTGRNGLVVFYNTGKNNRVNAWKFLRYDTRFTEMSDRIVNIEPRHSLVDYKYCEQANALHLLFFKHQSAVILKYDLFQNSFIEKKVKLPKEIRHISDFAVSNNLFAFGSHSRPSTLPSSLIKTVVFPLWFFDGVFGVFRYKPNVRYYVGDFNKEECVYFGQSDSFSYTTGITGSAQNQEVSIVSHHVNKSESFLQLTWHHENKTESIKLDVPANHVFLNATVLAGENGSKYLVGSYYDSFSKRSLRLSQSQMKNMSSVGLYFGKIQNGKPEFIKLYPFSKLKNFFSFLSERQLRKMTRKQQRAEQKGKSISISTYLLFHEHVIMQNSKTIVIAEAFYPRYETYCYTTYTHNGMPTTTCTNVFIGWQFTHALVVAFSEDGEIVWDYALPIKGILTMDLRTKVRAITHNNEINLLYSSAGSIKSQVISDGVPVGQLETAKVETFYDSDEQQSNTISNVEYWYDNYFLASGYQMIRNKARQGGKKKRYVYYFNKMAYQVAE